MRALTTSTRTAGASRPWTPGSGRSHTALTRRSSRSIPRTRPSRSAGAKSMTDSPMPGLRACGDCAVEPGQPHQDGCDVARCTVCGWQRISCDHGSSDAGWGHIWTGRWPGDEEVEEGLAPELNDLAMRGATGQLRWDGQRWQPRASDDRAGAPDQELPGDQSVGSHFSTAQEHLHDSDEPGGVS